MLVWFVLVKAVDQSPPRWSGTVVCILPAQEEFLDTSSTQVTIKNQDVRTRTAFELVLVSSWTGGDIV